MMSLYEFDKFARSEWRGKAFYYDTESQRSDTCCAVVSARFSDYSVMLNPNCISFENAGGDTLTVTGVEYVEVEAVTASTSLVTLIPSSRRKESVFIYVR